MLPCLSKILYWHGASCASHKSAASRLQRVRMNTKHCFMHHFSTFLLFWFRNGIYYGQYFVKKILPSLINSEPYATNSGDALYSALKYSDTDVIYFITDGFPTWGDTDVDFILNKVNRLNRNRTIINSVMVGLPGATTNRYGRVVFLPEARPKELYDFLHQLADQNGGAYVGR